MRKKLLAILFLSVFTFNLTGCSNTAEQPDASVSTEAESGTSTPAETESQEESEAANSENTATSAELTEAAETTSQDSSLPMTTVAADMVILSSPDANDKEHLFENGLRLLMIRRGGDPYKGQWALPGGMVEENETTETAAERELQEETGLTDVWMEQVYTVSTPGRDPRRPVMSCSYMAIVDENRLDAHAGDDAADLGWFDLTYDLQNTTEEDTDNGHLTTYEYLLTLTKPASDSNEAVTLTATIDHCVTQTEFAEKSELVLVDQDGLAFDHGLIIAHTLEKLLSQSTEL